MMAMMMEDEKVQAKTAAHSVKEARSGFSKARHAVFAKQ